MDSQLFIEALDEILPFHPILTGSRFFGTDRPDSDWDFFIQHSTDLVDHLTAWGWSKIGEAYKDDPNTAAVYQKGNVQIQLVHDQKLKETLQQLIARLVHSPYSYQDEDTMRILWTLGYDCLKLVDR